MLMDFCNLMAVTWLKSEFYNYANPALADWICGCLHISAGLLLTE